ncbi:transposase [Methanosarcina sp. 2.H.T.1A.6]|uniref:IS66 family transposase n=1 Tax=Methanosarcina sp. 2.H.T.1A.6 TaxID=1483599 RepID=UPI00138E09CE
MKNSVINGDETGINVGGQREQCHLISTKKYTYYFHHEGRGFKAMNKMGVLPKYRGIIVHDFWKSYFKYKCEHALCNVHIQRELKQIYEKHKQEWAKEMSDLLYEIKEHADCVPGKRNRKGNVSALRKACKRKELRENGVDSA